MFDIAASDNSRMEGKKVRVQTYPFSRCGNICLIPEGIWMFWIYIGNSARILDKPLEDSLFFESEVA